MLNGRKSIITACRCKNSRNLIFLDQSKKKEQNQIKYFQISLSIFLFACVYNKSHSNDFNVIIRYACVYDRVSNEKEKKIKKKHGC